VLNSRLIDIVLTNDFGHLTLNLKNNNMKQLTILGAIAIFTLSFAKMDKPTGLNKGEMAPDFTAKDQMGKSVSLKAQLKTGSVVLVFYRGQWCPYCNKQLSALQDSLSMITEKGATLLAVSPEKQENIMKTVEKTKATYSVVSDDQLKIMNAYKVTFGLDEATTKKYKGYGIDLADANGANGNSLPVPAVYVIGKDGKIVYRYFDENYAKRMSVKEILSML
jgi:peroxiredoxin